MNEATHISPCNRAALDNLSPNWHGVFDKLGSVWHFFHCGDLGKAMQRLKSQLQARGLLHITNILHAEESNQLRFWYSPDPDSIGKVLEG